MSTSHFQLRILQHISLGSEARLSARTRASHALCTPTPNPYRFPQGLDVGLKDTTNVLITSFLESLDLTVTLIPLSLSRCSASMPQPH